jgi:hypothetical protein
LAVYRQVLQLAPQDAAIALPACRALERIYAGGDARQFSEILRIEVKLEDDSEARRELRGRLGPHLRGRCCGPPKRNGGTSSRSSRASSRRGDWPVWA